MIQVPLQNVPNQTLTIRLSDDFYSISLNEINGLMAITITRNGVLIVSGERAIPQYPVIPYRYLEAGNFLFITSDDEYPYYDKFGISQFLVFATQEELEQIRGT